MALHGAEELVFRKFGGGLVLDVDPTEIGDDQASDAGNVDFEDETVSKRKGRVAYNASAPSGTDRVLGLHRYYSRSGGDGVFLAAMRLTAGGSQLYEDTGSGFSVAVDADTNPLTALTGQTPVDFIGWRERVYAGNGVDPLYRRSSAAAWEPAALLDGPAAAPDLALSQTILEAFDSGAWTISSGSALTTNTYDTDIHRQGTGCFKLTASANTARGKYVHKIWSGATTVATTLSGSIANGSVTSCSVVSAAGLAVGDYLLIESEVVLVTAIVGTTLSITRGQGGTTAASHGTVAVSKAALDLSEAEHLSVWVYAERINMTFRIGVRSNDYALDFALFPTFATQQKETWVRYRIPLAGIPAADRSASPGLALQFVERPSGVNLGTTNLSLYFDEARPEGPLVPDHYYYYATHAETVTQHEEPVIIRESNPTTAGEVDVPEDDAALGISVTVTGTAAAEVDQICVYRRRRDGPFTRARLVRTLDNPGAGNSATFIDTLGEDELAETDAPELVSGKIPPPIAKAYAVCNARLAAGHVYEDTSDPQDGPDTWHPWRLHLSRLGYPEEFGGDREPADPNAPGWLDISTRDHIRRLVEFDGQLLVFCDRAIYTLEGSGWDDFAFRKRADVGLDARNAVAAYDRYLLFLASDGVRVLAPNRSQEGLFETWVVSEPVDGRLRAIPAAYRGDVAFGLDERARLHVSFTATGGAANTVGLIFDPTTAGALAAGATPNRRGWSYYTNWGFSCFCTLKRGGGDAGQLVGGDPSAGKVHYLHRSPANAGLETDDGSAIDWYWAGRSVDAGAGRNFEWVYVGGEFDAAANQTVTSTPLLDGAASATTYPLALGSAASGFRAIITRTGARIRGRFAGLKLSGSHSVALRCRSARVGYYLR